MAGGDASRPGRGPATRHIPYEVWDNREALRGVWESEFLRKFQSRLATEQLLVGPPDMRLPLNVGDALAHPYLTRRFTPNTISGHSTTARAADTIDFTPPRWLR